MNSNPHENYEGMSHILEDAADIYEQQRKFAVDELVSTLEVMVILMSGHKNLARQLMQDSFRDDLTKEEEEVVMNLFKVLTKEVDDLDHLCAIFQSESDNFTKRGNWIF